MKPIEETILAAMDCTDKDILPFLPYILQDFWTIGSEPKVMIELIKKHRTKETGLRILDLGCGKGAVSVSIAKELGYECYGIDAIADFIAFAREKAREFSVDHLCRFEQGDIRDTLRNTDKYDIIILGAIGQVLGNYSETLTMLKPHLSADGIILIDDGYMPDDSTFSHPNVLKKAEMIRQITMTKMELRDEVTTHDDEDLSHTYDNEFALLSRRCDELAAANPEKAYLFHNYKQQQHIEYNNMKSDIICATMVVVNA